MDSFEAWPALEIAGLDHLLKILGEELLVYHSIVEQVSICDYLDLLNSVELLVSGVLLEKLNKRFILLSFPLQATLYKRNVYVKSKKNVLKY